LKSIRGLVLVWVAVALALVGVERLLRADPSRRNWEFFPDMATSRAAESFAADAFLPGGTTLQPPVAGVVVRGSEGFAYGHGPDEALRAGAELAAPFALDDPAVVAAGETVFRTFCVVCHDAQGGGRGTVVLRGGLPPPSLLGARALEMPDGQMFHVLTRGQGNMPSYAAQIPSDDRWKVIAWVRDLQKRSTR
jgi:mono/diheme cytochrome c family protein